jgi:hypothetical protein
MHRHVSFLRYVRTAALIAAAPLACATPQATVTGSSASGQLLDDTTQLVMVVDAQRAPDCSEARQITAEPVEPDKEGITAERWKVERCGSVKFYRIRYRPDSASGTDFSVQEEAAPALEGRRKQRFTPPGP